jgi:hypothetical protein
MRQLVAAALGAAVVLVIATASALAQPTTNNRSATAVCPATAGCVVTSDLAAGAVTAPKIASGAIANSAINSAAAIDGSKIVPDFGTKPVTGGQLRTAGPQTYAASMIGGMTGNVTATTTDLLVRRVLFHAPNQSADLHVTSPTAAQLVGAIPNAHIGDVFQFTLIDARTTTAFPTFDFTGGAGVTVREKANLILVIWGATYTVVCQLTNVTPGSEAITCY